MSENTMWEIEDGLGLRLICGVDEAGRGPLAGPVCAAAVILPEHLQIPGLNDSKKLTDKKRRELYPIIQEQAIAYGIGFASQEEIDSINILQATKNAMRRAAAGAPATLFLIDAVDRLGLPGEERGIIAFYYPGSTEGRRAAELIAAELRKIPQSIRRHSRRSLTSSQEILKRRATLTRRTRREPKPTSSEKCPMRRLTGFPQEAAAVRRECRPNRFNNLR